MFNADLSTRGHDGHIVVALHGELDQVDAASVAAALTAVVARTPEIIMDLAALTFIDSSGVAALAHRGEPGCRGNLVLAAPQQQVRRACRYHLADAFSVHASVAEAAGRPGAPGRWP